MLVLGVCGSEGMFLRLSVGRTSRTRQALAGLCACTPGARLPCVPLSLLYIGAVIYSVGIRVFLSHVAVLQLASAAAGVCRFFWVMNSVSFVTAEFWPEFCQV